MLFAAALLITVFVSGLALAKVEEQEDVNFTGGSHSCINDRREEVRRLVAGRASS